MSAMWFIGHTSGDKPKRVALAESHVLHGVRDEYFEFWFNDKDGNLTKLDIASVRCVNSSEMLRFMRGEEVKP